MATIRPEQPGDSPPIRALHRAAFAGGAEADLVDGLRDARNLSLSLIAEIDGEVVGHVAFSPITAGADSRMIGLGLAPIAVAPTHQRQGVGSRLIEEGLKLCRESGCGVVVVLGDPKYYGRFGFLPASRRGFYSEFTRGDAFQLIELRPGSLPASGGLISYAPQFALVS